MSNETASSGETLSGYFDDALSPAECATLSLRLQSDPAAALEFARTARVHSLLEGLAPPRPAGRAVLLRRRWLSLGAAAALVATAAATAALYFRKQPAESTQKNLVVYYDGLDGHRRTLPPGVKLRTVRADAASAPSTPSNLNFLLSNFYIHTSPDWMTVPEALTQLERSIAEANLLNRRELAALRFTAGRSIFARPMIKEATALQFDKAAKYFTQDDYAAEEVATPLSNWSLTRKVISPLTGPLTIKEYLDVCGLYQEVLQQPGNVAYASPIYQADESARVEEETYHTDSNLFGGRFLLENDEPGEHLRRKLQLTGVLQSGNASGSSRRKLPPEISRDPGGWQASNTPVSVDKASASFTVTASRADLDRIADVLKVCAQRKVVQHYLTTKYILCPPALLPSGFDPDTGMILSDQQFQTLARALSQSPEAELGGAPAVVIRPLQPASIHNMAEIPSLRPVDPGMSDWVGVQQDVLTACVGETIQVSGMVDWGLPANAGMFPLSGVFGETADLRPYITESAKHYRTGYDLWIPRGCTALFTLDVDTGGRGVFLAALTAQEINAAGEPVGQ